MSIPYTSEDFTTPRAGAESWIEYPFIDYGDNTSKVYHMRCSVNKDNYTPIAIDTTMTSASNADVLVLPFTVNANAYYVGDFNHRVLDGNLLEFDRQFATIPATRTEYDGSVIYEYPGIGLNGSSRSRFNEISKIKTIYTYGLGANITLDSIFQVTLNNYNFDDYNVQDSGLLITATDPTATEYIALTDLVYNSEIVKYIGNIYAKKTTYVDAK